MCFVTIFLEPTLVFTYAPRISSFDKIYNMQEQVLLNIVFFMCLLLGSCNGFNVRQICLEMQDPTAVSTTPEPYTTCSGSLSPLPPRICSIWHRVSLIPSSYVILLNFNGIGRRPSVPSIISKLSKHDTYRKMNGSKQNYLCIHFLNFSLLMGGCDSDTKWQI